MRLKFNALALGAAIAAAGASQSVAADIMIARSAAPPPLFTVNDNSVSYAYRFNATSPFVTDHTQKSVISFTHFDTWAYGTNFFNIDLLKSDLKDPSNPCLLPGHPATGCEGATEIYGFFRSTLGWKELFGLRFGTFLTNISFKVGGDANSENNANAAAKKDVVAGLQFNFDLPFGATFNVAPLYYQEKNHSGFITVNSTFGNTATGGPTSGTVYFNGTWRVEGALIVPIGPKGTPLKFGSLFGINGPKGLCPAGDCAATAVPTKTEYFTQQSLNLDVGQLAYGRPNILSVFVAYVYWQNKFGIDHNLDPTGGTTESTFLTGATVRF
jgi:hypothetical protein